MLYVSDKRLCSLEVTDSGSRESFWVKQEEDGYYLNGKAFRMDLVLGVLDGVVFEVSEQLVGLMGYIESVNLVYTADKYIRVSHAGVKSVLFHGAYIKMDKIVMPECDLLQVLMCASYDNRFVEMLETGAIFVQFGFRDFLRIEFCGNYMPYIMKMVVMHRKSKRYL